jgi:tripartite-type tricarboxylate transporter receptor subunit TctC
VFFNRGRTAARRLTLASIIAIAGAAPAAAQGEYPVRPVRIIMGSTPGGSGDIGARLVAAKLSERLGQPFVVENKPGAAGTIAAEQVMRAEPDGYTLLFTASWHSTVASMRKTLPYDSVNDFTWISTLTTYGMMLGVRQDSPFRRLGDLIAYAKANPRKLTYYSVGIGSGHHLIGEWFLAEAGIEIVHVPYRGSSAAFPDFLAGRVDVMIDTMTFALTQAKAGTVRPLAITSDQPMEELPGVPTTAQVLPSLRYDSWLGLLGPRNLPAPVLQRLNNEMQEIVKLPDVVARLKELGATPRASTPEEFRKRVESEIVMFRQVVEKRGIPTQ